MKGTSLIRRFVFVLAVATTAAFLCSAVATAGTFPLIICGSSARDPGDGLTWSAASPMVATAQCPYNGPGLELYVPASRTVVYNQTAAFKIAAPAGITVYSIHVVHAYSSGIGSGGWWGEFYWNGGPGPVGRSGALSDVQFNNGGCCSPTNLQSQTIGWFITCNQPTCSSGNGGRVRGMGELDLTAEENQAPAISASSANSLWYQNGWVRGTWPTSFTATDPSGVCGAAVVFGSLPAIVTPTPDTAPNRHSWQQCPQQSVPAAVDTSASDGTLGRGEGGMQLRLTATNTANVTANATKTVYVDNAIPTISLSGPTDAPSTAGTQYVTAAGSAGLSGVSGIGCSVDNAPYQWYPQASVQVPVAGVGVHRVTCYSANNARDVSGRVATSALQTWTLSIRQPTVSAVGFGKLVDALLCKRVTKRVRVPAHWVTVRRHHKRVRVRERARTKLERVTSCHVRVVRRRITVWKTVIRHGKKMRVKRHKTIRVVEFPHVVMHSSEGVGYGKRTTISGWLGMPDGTALAGQLVDVLSAPDNELGQFSLAAVATTAADGTWSAQLAAGPSRLVEAFYPAAATLEPSVSVQVHVVVPAKVKLLNVSPSGVAWGGTVRITGQLVGGYLPAGGALVRLRIGQGSSYQTYGVQEHVTGNGRFTTSYTFGAGYARIFKSFWFQIATLPMGDYPYAPAASGRRSVLVGGHPRPPATHRRHKHKRKRYGKR